MKATLLAASLAASIAIAPQQYGNVDQYEGGFSVRLMLEDEELVELIDEAADLFGLDFSIAYVDLVGLETVLLYIKKNEWRAPGTRCWTCGAHRGYYSGAKGNPETYKNHEPQCVVEQILARGLITPPLGMPDEPDSEGDLWLHTDWIEQPIPWDVDGGPGSYGYWYRHVAERGFWDDPDAYSAWLASEDPDALPDINGEREGRGWPRAH